MKNVAEHPEMRSISCPEANHPQKSLPHVRDLVDFHLNWPEIRPFARAIIDRAMLPDEERQVMMWLISLADRIGKKDII